MKCRNYVPAKSASVCQPWEEEFTLVHNVDHICANPVGTGFWKTPDDYLVHTAGKAMWMPETSQLKECSPPISENHSFIVPIMNVWQVET